MQPTHRRWEWLEIHTVWPRLIKEGPWAVKIGKRSRCKAWWQKICPDQECIDPLRDGVDQLIAEAAAKLIHGANTHTVT